MSYKRRLVLYFANVEKNNKFRTTETVYVNDGEQNTIMQTIADFKKAKLIRADYDFKPMAIPDALKHRSY